MYSRILLKEKINIFCICNFFFIFHSIKNGVARTNSQSLLFLSFAVDSSGFILHFYDLNPEQFCCFSLSCACLKISRRIRLALYIFPPKTLWIQRCLLSARVEIPVSAASLKSPGLLQLVLHKLNACPSVFNRGWTKVLPRKLQVCSPRCAFHRVCTCRGDRAWLGPRSLAAFQAGKKGAVGKQALKGLPDPCASRLCRVNHPAGSQPRKYL